MQGRVDKADHLFGCAERPPCSGSRSACPATNHEVRQQQHRKERQGFLAPRDSAFHHLLHQEPLLLDQPVPQPLDLRRPRPKSAKTPPPVHLFTPRVERQVRWWSGRCRPGQRRKCSETNTSSSFGSPALLRMRLTSPLLSPSSHDVLPHEWSAATDESRAETRRGGCAGSGRTSSSFFLSMCVCFRTESAQDTTQISTPAYSNAL